MDSSISSPKSTKLQKLGEKGESNSKDADRISSLPDGILQHILAFLPTHYAVHTCVLSKRWKHIWIGIPVLNFDDMEMHRNKPYEDIHFLNFMENVLGLHDTTVLDKFRFVLARFDAEHADDEDRLLAMLSEVLRRKIQNLNVTMFDVYSPFPSSLYDCKTLTMLKLHGVPLKFPLSVCFPNLKYIKFKFVKIRGEEGVKCVSLSCPSLEKARFIDCDWYIKAMDIFVPKLVWLTIDDIDDSFNTNYKVNFYAESLATLEVFSCLTYDLCFHNLLSLYDVSIYIGKWNETPDRVSKLIQAISHVKVLTLYCPTISKLSSVKDLLLFSKLENLIVDMSGSMNGESLTEFFCSLPPLRSLIFMKGLDKNSTGAYDWSLDVIPQSFLLHLKNFEINGFYGNETELSLVDFLVKNASAIETICVDSISSPALSADPKKKFEVIKRLCNMYDNPVDEILYFT